MAVHGNERGGQRGRVLTRAAVARRLGIGITTVRRLEGTTLHPTVGPGGVRQFSAEEVERLASQRSAKSPAPTSTAGEVAAEAFRMFRDGYDFPDIVIRLRQTPAVIRQLFADYCRGLGV